jgi:hypothetical protein
MFELSKFEPVDTIDPDQLEMICQLTGVTARRRRRQVLLPTNPIWVESLELAKQMHCFPRSPLRLIEAYGVGTQPEQPYSGVAWRQPFTQYQHHFAMHSGGRIEFLTGQSNAASLPEVITLANRNHLAPGLQVEAPQPYDIVRFSSQACYRFPQAVGHVLLLHF